MNEILHKGQIVASEIMRDLPASMRYHNLHHTSMVVATVKMIGLEEGLAEDDLSLAQLAAWFHDTGFKDSYDGHEQESCKIAEEFMKAEGVGESDRNKVVEAIRSTTREHQPQDIISMVLCDADLYHIASPEYHQIADNLRTEWAIIQNNTFTDVGWLKNSLEFLSKVKFWTKYGHHTLKPAVENLRKELKKSLKKAQKSLNQDLQQELGVTEDELKAMQKKLEKASGRPERGIETMFRLTSKNHLTLSGMADTKANIMVSVNAIIISVMIGSLMQKLDTNPHLIMPVAILLLVNLLSMIFAILSTRPNVTSGKFTRADIEQKKANLLFFGNFHQMPRNDYQWGMKRLMEQSNYLYSALIDDIYFLGVVLGKKYRYLRISYNIFMYGIVVAVAAFIIANVFFR